jgi:hypothetical protein
VDVVRCWPLRDLLLAYLEQLRALARQEYFVDMLVWAVLAPYQKRKSNAPALPKILKGA